MAVSGYGTVRELIRLRESNLLEKIDTIIIQYCYNDHGENVHYKKTTLDAAKKNTNLLKRQQNFLFGKNFVNHLDI